MGLISCDYSADKIYIHSGISSTISNFFNSPTVEPSGLTIANGNLISCDWGTNYVHPKIYIHAGITDSISSSFDSPEDWPNGPSGLAFDGTNLISCSQNGMRIYIHDGITSTTTDDFASPGTAPCGLTYIGGNLVSCDYDADKIYIHSGISSTVSSNFASPDTSPYGLTNDGTNLISCDYGTDKIYKHSGITSSILDSFDSPGRFPSGLTIVFLELVVTTQAAAVPSPIPHSGYQFADGHGTIVSGEEITDRGFEVKHIFSGNLYDRIKHSIAGFEGDAELNIDNLKWEGTLIKTENEENDFETGAFTLELGAFPSYFYDQLFAGESYTYRAYAINDIGTGYGDWVAFSLEDFLTDVIEDDISDGNPVVPIIPIEPIEWEFPEFIWEMPEIELPPWVLPDLPSWEFPDYPPMSFVGDFYYRKPYTKKDLDDLRKKCIIYNKNSIEFALVLRHNMNVLREFFNMMTDYMDKEEFNDFTDLIPPQRLKELYLDPLELNNFRDIINEFIRNTVDNNIAVNRNFKLIQDGLSDYETESDDAYFKEINTNIKTVIENNPDVHRLKRVIDSLNQEVSMNFNDIMRNLKIIRARLL